MGRLEVLAERVREIAEALDHERQRTATDLTKEPAVIAAEQFLRGPGYDSYHLRKYGERLGEEVWRLSLLPDAPPTYETFQAPSLEDEDDPFN